MVNKVTLIGNLGADPEARTAGSGTVVANLRLATSRRAKDRDGNWNDKTEWHSVVCFGKTAEAVQKYCQKGKQLYVEGRLQTRKWQDKEGRDRWSTEVVAHEVKFLGGREGGAEGGSTRTRPVSRQQPQQQQGGGYRGGSADPNDITF